jgi:uncharacterized protein YecE (DUF72 family)
LFHKEWREEKFGKGVKKEEGLYGKGREHSYRHVGLAGRTYPKEITADFVYMRLHGPTDVPYKGQYSTRALSGWAGAISTWERQEREIFCYFDNDEAGYAPQDALRLQKTLGSG